MLGRFFMCLYKHVMPRRPSADDGVSCDTFMIELEGKRLENLRNLRNLGNIRKTLPNLPNLPNFELQKKPARQMSDRPQPL